MTNEDEKKHTQDECQNQLGQNAKTFVRSHASPGTQPPSNDPGTTIDSRIVSVDNADKVKWSE